MVILMTWDDGAPKKAKETLDAQSNSFFDLFYFIFFAMTIKKVYKKKPGIYKGRKSATVTRDESTGICIFVLCVCF